MKKEDTLYELNRPRINSHPYSESHCNFMKAPALTREILGKVHSDIVPKNTSIFGHQLQTKNVLVLAALSLIFTISVFLTIIMWFTSSFDELVLSNLVITNNTDSFIMWKHPPAKLRYNIYIFNYTNVEDYKRNRADKLHLQELGPYVYEEVLERIDISFLTEDTISYKEKRHYEFLPNLSKGNKNDQLVVPNIPVISGSAVVREKNFFNRLAFSGLLSGIGEDGFLNIAADSYIYGYKDRLNELAKNFLSYDTVEDVGLIAAKKGETRYKLTINTGKKDINKIRAIEKFNDMDQFDYYSSDSCNSIESTDGASHSLTRVRYKQPLFYLFPEACRRIPLLFEKEVTALDMKVPAYRYSVPEDLFDSVEEKPENSCYCSLDSINCPLKGLFNTTVCNKGSPIFLSHPHFHRGDPSLFKHFTGLYPERKYNSYIDIHPKMGFAMTGRTVFQINIQVQKARGVSQVDMFEDGMILPLAYFVVVVDQRTYSRELNDVIYLLTFTVPSIELALKFGSLLTLVITLTGISLVLRKMSTLVSKNKSQKLLKNDPEMYGCS